MTLKVKKDGTWKEASSLKVKIGGEWKDVSTLYSKKDGAWVTVYSSGALITFTNYPYPIPVAKGWKYSTDKVNWTTVTSDSTINSSGTFTGWVKANKITLSGYSTKYTAAVYKKKSATSMGYKRCGSVSFVNGSKGYVCGGYSNGAAVDVYTESGTRTAGNNLASGRYRAASFEVGSKGYVCGGASNDTNNPTVYDTVDVFDLSGNRTTGSTLRARTNRAASFVIGSKGFICGGTNTGKITGSIPTVQIIDSSGNITQGSNLSKNRSSSNSFVIGSKGYICGGNTTYSTASSVEVLDSSGNITSADSLSSARAYPGTFSNNNKGYVCGGGDIGTTVVDVYDASGIRSTGSPLRDSKWKTTQFVINSKGYVCGGYKGYEYDDGDYTETWYSSVDIYNSNGVRTSGTSLNSNRSESTSFTLGNIAFVCGGRTSFSASGYSNAVEMYYDIPEEVYTKLPITEGSTYTLNGESGTADVSKVMEFDSKVSGTIKYKAGDLSPSIKITVVDESGNVVEGATISIEKMSNNWDISNINVTITAESS